MNIINEDTFVLNLPSAKADDLIDLFPSTMCEAVREGKYQMLAVATGEMSDRRSEWSVQFVLLHGRTVDSEPRMYLVYDLVQRELETAMLVDSAGFPVHIDREFTCEQAVEYWIRGFESWNERCPGLYQLKYALVKD